MHYYQHHIGDFIRETSRLSDSQSMAYLRMIWLYYETEQPLPNNPAAIGFKVGADEQLVQLILEAYFKPEGSVWRHTRCDKEIAEYQVICERNQANGKAGGRPKKTQSVPTGKPKKTQSVPSGMPTGTETEPSGNPTVTLTSIHEPVTSNHGSEANASAGRTPAELTRDELWAAGKSLLTEAGIPPRQCGSFVGKLVKDYGDAIVIEAVRAAVVARPVDPVSYLKGACLHAAGKRSHRPARMSDEERDAWNAAEGVKARELLFGSDDRTGHDVIDIETHGVQYAEN